MFTYLKIQAYNKGKEQLYQGTQDCIWLRYHRVLMYQVEVKRLYD